MENVKFRRSRIGVSWSQWISPAGLCPSCRCAESARTLRCLARNGYPWKTRIPGLAHSSPIVWQDEIFVTTAISSRPDASFKRGLYGEGDASDDLIVQQWKLTCLDRGSGKIVWERTGYQGHAEREAAQEGEIYRERLPHQGSGFSASPVASDERGRGHLCSRSRTAF